MSVQPSDGAVLGGIPSAQPVTGGDWMDKALNALVQVQTARYAARFAGSMANQYTGGAAVPMDGNPNAPTQQPVSWNTSSAAMPGLVVSQDVIVYGVIAGVVLLAIALD